MSQKVMRLLVTALALLCLGVCADTQNPMELHGLSLSPAPGKEHLRETEIKQLRQELSEMKDLMANVLAFKASEAITEATQQQNRRKLKVLDTKDFVGLRVKVDDAVVALGAKQDVSLVRSGKGKASFVGDLNVQGKLSVNGVGLDDYIKATFQKLMKGGGGGGDGSGGKGNSWYTGPKHCVSGFTEAYKGYCYKEMRNFKQSSSEFKLKVPAGLESLRVVLVGGGAGGGGRSGGGGGGGAVVDFPTFPVTPGETLSFNTGKGGAAGIDPRPCCKAKPGGNGGKTYVVQKGKEVLTAMGGGGGAGDQNTDGFEGGNGGGGKYGSVGSASLQSSNSKLSPASRAYGHGNGGGFGWSSPYNGGG